MLRRTLSPPERFVIVALLAFGLVACLATPISAGYDEETHFIRAWEMAHLHFIPNEQLGSRLPFPALYWELSYRRQPIVEAADPGLWSKYGSLPLDAHDYVYANVETRSVYSPALLLPQALALRYLGLSLKLPALPVYYACRIAGLLSYLILGWLAVRLIPFGKWLLAVLVVSPMALYQARSALIPSPMESAFSLWALSWRSLPTVSGVSRPRHCLTPTWRGTAELDPCLILAGNNGHSFWLLLRSCFSPRSI